MKRSSKLNQIAIIFCLFLIQSTALSQSKRQIELEEKRQQILNDISKINNLVFKGNTKKKSLITRVEDLDYKISVHQNLINITNLQANLLTKEINTNQKTITKLRNKLKLLKDEYGAMIVKSYKNKSDQSKVMFLLSSENFQQAYKRLQYIKQYANYKKKQGDFIKTETEKLQQLNNALSIQKKEKKEIINQNRIAKNELKRQLKAQQELITSIQNDLSSYKTRIRKRQQEANAIDKEIEKIIREAMAESNIKAGKAKTSKTFALTAEEKLIAKDFATNKGKLPWPLERGVVTLGYGTRPHPIDRSLRIKSNGIRIDTNKGSTVRSIFNGTVLQIMTPKNGNKTVMVRHGNYITAYKNMSKIYVKKGDYVSTKQSIGEVLTNTISGKTSLTFYIYKDNKYLNPSSWIAQN